MPLRDSFSVAINRLRTHPELFLIGSGIGVLQAVVYVVFASIVLATIPIRGFTTVAPILSIVFVLPLFIAVYELVFHPDRDETVRESLSRAVRAAITSYPRVFVTDVTVSAASLVGGILVGMGWYVVATGGRYIRYVTSDPGGPGAFETVFLVGAAVVLGGLVANFAFRFADILTAYHGYSPIVAVASSARFARRNRVPLAGFILVVFVIQFFSLTTVGGVNAIVAATSDQSLPVLVGGILLFIILNGATVTLTGVLHAVFFDQHHTLESVATPASTRQLIKSWSWARWTLAVVLIAGLVTGAAVVRTVDAGVYTAPDISRITTNNPDRAVETATRNTAMLSHKRVLYMRNMSDESSAFRPFTRIGVDLEDRQAYVYFVKTNSDGETIGGFYGEGTIGMLRSGGQFSGPIAYQSGDWGVMMMPGSGQTGSGDGLKGSMIPTGPDHGWEIVRSNESKLVVQVTSPDAIQSALGSQGYAGETVPLMNESHVRVHIDRDRGVLKEVRFHLHSRETGKNFQYRLVYRDVGTTDLKRPVSIRNRQVVEHVWDAVYY